MAGDNATSTATATATSTGGTGTGGGGDKGRLDKLESKVDALLEALHSGGRQAVKGKLEANQSIADQVQAELDRRDKAAKDEQARQEVTTLREEVARLKEVKPAEPLRRVTRFMFGNPDRDGQEAGK